METHLNSENISIQDLADEVLVSRQKPSDQYEVAALLESNGWSDQLAKEKFGVENVFDLSKLVWKTMKQNVVYAPFTPMKNILLKRYSVSFFRYFFKGAVFALPMAISVFSMLTLKFSLWSYESFNTELATAIAIGTILSFLSIGGFTQAIARQGYGHIRQGYFGIAKLTTFFFVRWGYILSLAVVAILIIANLLLGIFTGKMLTIIVLYYFILNAIWLSVTIMYILDYELIFSGLLVLGIGIIFVLFKIFKINIIASQLISLAIVAILGGIIALLIFTIKGRKKKKDEIEPSMQRKTIILNTVFHYFIYGFSYFAYLFTDRIIAWSTNDVYMPYVIWFRGEYELGLDFALLILIIPMGFVEFIIRSMMNSISKAQKDYYMYEVDKMHRRYYRMYIFRLLLILLFAILSGILVYILVILIRKNYFPMIDIGISDTTFFVFIIALIGYAFTAMGLLNVEIMFCVAQPKMATKTILPGLLTTIVVGFILSRVIHYSYAVVGLLAGSIVFFAVGGVFVVKLLKKLDYYLYMAS